MGDGKRSAQAIDSYLKGVWPPEGVDPRGGEKAVAAG
jgi:hypothetical protein